MKQVGISRYNNSIGVVASGDLESRGFCTESGLRNLDKPQKHRTFPADCEKQQLGLWRGDQFCGNMKVLNDDRSILPCYKAPISSQRDPRDPRGIMHIMSMACKYQTTLSFKYH